ncbi:AAA family ATPase [Kineosporia sp. NBRC 101731]|uniref:HelD family protein n=1 Tax=Kineosporia sp. NBRC 101731 TaxID=3032199 RepID=UPI0024A23D43|nr:AAA family ATPase [Kineosporia sp. NBRC 101731]GLY31728.1 DNA helicase [Kineosporia sp. NBRC 101731]
MSAALDDVLGSEQDYLARARADLEMMRQQVLSLDVQGGNEVSAQYLSAALYHRAQALRDDPGTTLFFGRTDHDNGNRWYVGRRHVADPKGDPVVIDWRAEVAKAFYQASRNDRMSVQKRRRFGIEQGTITAYEDEVLTDTASEGEPEKKSQILAHEIERPRAGPMRDIVATIQPEQDVIVRADIDTSVCIQGAPGTGKTAVGLHRAAWLLYAFRDRLARSGVLVVGPNESFLEHVNAVLPSLGEAQVRHATVEQLVVTSPGGAEVLLTVKGSDTPAVTGLKGDARMAEVLRRAVWAGVTKPVDALVLPRGARKYRVPGYQIAEIVEELKNRGVRYAAAKDMLPQRISHAVLLMMEEAGDSPDDRVQDAVARSREVKKYADTVWPAVDPKKLLFSLLSDPQVLARHAEGILTDAEQKLLIWEKPSRTVGSAKWSQADAVLIDEMTDLTRRSPSMGHVVLDEAQDLSPMQLRAVGRRCSTGSMTVLGDIAQGTTPWATPSWEVTLEHLGQVGAVIDELDRGFRVPDAVIRYAARLLPSIAPGLNAPTSVRDSPGSLRILPAQDEGERWTLVETSVREALAELGSIGLIVPDSQVLAVAAQLRDAGIEHSVLGPHGAELDGACDAPDPLSLRVSVVPATTAKGLEYDWVIVLEPTTIAAEEPDERTGLRRLYVVLTRAVTGLTVVHSEPLPEVLAR